MAYTLFYFSREKHLLLWKKDIKNERMIIMLNVGKIGKFVIQIAVGTVVGVAMNEFVDKHMNKPLQKFMDSMAEEKYKMDKEKIEKGL